MRAKKQNFPFIKSIRYHINDDNAIVLEMMAYWPNPSWRHLRTNIKKEGSTAIVEYYGETSGGITIQVIKEFTTTIIIGQGREVINEIIMRGRDGDQYIKNIS